ncbi:fructose-1,6-bisphosphatase [Mariprofundus erugo]|uniref:class 1 fructose-bisphosphatase n=1 Tax=Mariprofundus erugo TaxID=2528639 RepID=UPI0010FEA472|nr:class 1 fructose-bisphosphatase [Mariprofundus erugo]TLS73717.1 fructose-1,6-bisphosphatase [Mariprofundus erugo]
MPTTLNSIAKQGENGAAMMPIIQGVGRAAIEIAAVLRGAVFRGVLGGAGSENVQGEQQQKLDVLSDEIFLEEMRSTGFVCAVGSEEQEELLVIDEYAHADYVVLTDPLDGSSNLDVDGPVGTIFSVVKRKTANSDCPHVSDTLQSGRNVIAAGYVLYGPATMLVCSVGDGVHGYTFNPSAARFELSHANIRIPAKGGYYSVNEANKDKWLDNMGANLDRMKDETGLGMRYVGAMVADMHRTLLKGGVFLYPADEKNANGKLRLLYEAIPMGFVMEQAGGKSMSKGINVLDIEPEELHQRVPVYLGAAANVDSLLG